ncbi:hypothetical protein Mapa_015349 [Marchantia paleacea]|nr:hypothetical protein Mapa_015349 [Marchantia paleacea]
MITPTPTHKDRNSRLGHTFSSGASSSWRCQLPGCPRPALEFPACNPECPLLLVDAPQPNPVLSATAGDVSEDVPICKAAGLLLLFRPTSQKSRINPRFSISQRSRSSSVYLRGMYD